MHELLNYSFDVWFISGVLNISDYLSRCTTKRGTPFQEALLTADDTGTYNEIDEVLRPYVRAETTIDSETHFSKDDVEQTDGVQLPNICPCPKALSFF